MFGGTYVSKLAGAAAATLAVGFMFCAAARADILVPAEDHASTFVIGRISSDLRRTLARLDKMASGLCQASWISRLATVGEVAVGVVHELNQPLSTIRMAADNALAALNDESPDRAYLSNKLDLVS